MGITATLSYPVLMRIIDYDIAETNNADANYVICHRFLDFADVKSLQ